MTFAAPRDQDVDGAFDAVLRQQLRRSKVGFFLKVVGDDDLAGVERIAGGRLQIDAQGYLADRLRLPSDACAHQQPVFLRHVLEDLGEGCFETLCAELRRSLQDCRAVRPNSPSKDCCLNRYGSSRLVAAVDPTRDVTDSVPARVGMN
jgi:hypothetical protein